MRPCTRAGPGPCRGKGRERVEISARLKRYKGDPFTVVEQTYHLAKDIGPLSPLPTPYSPFPNSLGPVWEVV